MCYSVTLVITLWQDYVPRLKIILKTLKPIMYTSDSFQSVQQHWCATKKEYYAIYQSVSISTNKEVHLHSNVTINHWNPS